MKAFDDYVFIQESLKLIACRICLSVKRSLLEVKIRLSHPAPDWSPLGVTKTLSHAQMVSFTGWIQNFRRASPSVSYGSPPPPPQMERNYSQTSIKRSPSGMGRLIA